MKKFLVIIMTISCFLFAGCDKSTTQVTDIDKLGNPTDNDIQKEEPKYNNTDYDGSYYFNVELGDKYIGYLVINNGSCKTENHYLGYNGRAVKRDYEGTCKYIDGKLIIDFKDSDPAYSQKYYCKINDKNLDCKLKSEYGIANNSDIVFTYKYSLDEWKEYQEYFSLYLPEKLKWNISGIELVENYGTDSIKTTTLNKELSWTHPLYSGSYQQWRIKEHTYLLYNNKLVAYFTMFRTDITNAYTTYSEIKDILVKKYGNPTSEKINWKDTTYKNDKLKWDDAMKYNHMDIVTTWNFGQYKLRIIWKYGETMRVEYVLNGYEDKI